MSKLSVIKYSSEDCGTCHRMSHYDSSVTKELGLDFIDVPMQDALTYRKYRSILLSLYPKKEGMGWPTYIVVESPDENFEIKGQIKGGMAKGDFRNKLNDILTDSH